MPKGPQGQQRPADAIGNSVHVAKIKTGEIKKTMFKQPVKRNSGLAGAKAGVENATKAQHSEIAREAASARWK